MSETLWVQRPLPPRPPVDSPAGRWEGSPTSAGHLTALRKHLRAALLDGARPAGAGVDDVERLLLVLKELVSNGLRHGRPPVRVTVETTSTGWLLDVTDAAVDRPPIPAVGRDAADGGLGLTDRTADRRTSCRVPGSDNGGLGGRGLTQRNRRGPRHLVTITRAARECQRTTTAHGRGVSRFRHMTAVQGDSDSAFDVHERLGDAMSRVARQIQEEHGDVEATLQAIASSAITIVPNAEECGITYVIARSKVEPRAWTSDLPRSVDALQQRLGQGPCLDAVWEQEIVRVDDVASDERWPEFARAAPDLGAGSMLCFQLFVDGDRLGALNLYARTPGAFDDDCQDIGLMFAAHAAIALAGAQHEQHLRKGMSNRDVIGQAKGILMERYRLTADQAFGVLTRASQEQNRKLVDIARELTDTGAVPGSDRRD